jgi:thioredoxin 1
MMINYCFFEKGGPCRMISPIFEAMAEKPENSAVTFVKVDVDAAQDVAAHCKIQAMPTFQFFKGGVKIGEMMGADAKKLEAMVAQHK